jgi:nifR3 family TIM-barrel protein
MAVQLFGSEPEFMAKAAEIALKFSPDIIDINMGCPAPKIVNNLSGSALMKNPTLAGEIIKAVAQAVDIPVTVKFRKGWDDESVNAVEFAEICEKNGASAICIHGRTKKQMYSPPVDIDIMREVKKAVSIPVIANGDVTDVDSAKEMYDKTGCDLIMIGRGALGHPWVFDDIKRGLYGESAKVLSVEEKMAVMREHIIKLCEYKGEVVGMKEARKHTAWYLKGFPNAAALRRETSSLNRLEDLDRLIDMVLGG